MGNKTIKFVQEFGQVSLLFWQIIKNLPKIVKSRKLLLHQMEHIGVNSLPLVLIIASFTGAVAAWQAAYQLKGLAPLSFLGGATTRAIITELGPVLTGIVIAGRVGASIAAEIGTMKVTEQIDALEIMAINPVRYLVMPRFVASVVMMPLILIFANVISIIGAYVVSDFFLGISYAVFFESVKRFFSLWDFSYGIIKTIFFGGIKLRENGLEVFRGDAAAGVFHRHPRSLLKGSGLHRQDSPFFHALYGIENNV